MSAYDDDLTVSIARARRHTQGAVPWRSAARAGDRIALLSHNNHTYAVVCFALARLGATSELTGFCRGRLAGYKTPKHVVIAESLPKNASGKILKRELRTEFAHPAG